jgi:hypothetical protein
MLLHHFSLAQFRKLLKCLFEVFGGTIRLADIRKHQEHPVELHKTNGWSVDDVLV